MQLYCTVHMFEYSILFVDSERILRIWRNVLLVRTGHRAREPGQHEVVRHERSQQSPEALLSQAAHLSHSRRFVQPPLGSRLVFSLSSFSTRLFVRARRTLFWVGFAVIVLCGRGKSDFALFCSALPAIGPGLGPRLGLGRTESRAVSLCLSLSPSLGDARQQKQQPAAFNLISRSFGARQSSIISVSN